MMLISVGCYTCFFAGHTLVWINAHVPAADALQVQDLEKLLSPEQLKQFQDMVKRRDVDQLLADEDQESPWWHAQLHENLPVWLEQYPQDLVPQWNGQMDGSSVVFNVLSALLVLSFQSSSRFSN